MTNQNVVVSKAAISMKLNKIRVSPQVAVLMPLLSLKEGEEHEAAAKINAWVDSMRASSPPRNNSACTLFETERNSNWIVKHPSALTMFEHIVKAAKGKQIVMFMDYDGTLSPIVEDPNRAFMSKEMRAAVKAVSRYFPAAIVTGRCIEKVCSFVQLGELYYAGSHGMDIKGPSKSSKFNNGNKELVCQPATEFLPMINEVYKTLIEKTKSIPGAKVENNKFCLSVHYRCVAEKSWEEVAEHVRSVLGQYPKLRLSQGRKVLEIRPNIKWDKGKALEFLLQSLGFGNSKDVLPIYIGDDRTDEDAFRVLHKRRQGFGILVSKVPKETNASYTLKDPNEVKDFLKRLVEWKRLTIQH